MCTQMLMHANCDYTWELYRHHKTKTKRVGTGSWLGTKSQRCHTRDSSLSVLCLPFQSLSQTLSQLSYSHPFATVTALFCVHCSVCVTYATAFVTVDWAVYCIDQHYTPSDDQILRMTSDIMLQHHSACNLCHFVTVCQCHCWLGNIREWPTL